ncbi:MAG: HlyD family efflux transporter periplasmic adaptor subunit [Anaerolineales bacterium]|nr:HlyD family efflux transporter periplasmic adaptor subunit [Anaerolineales bacterium]
MTAGFKLFWKKAALAGLTLTLLSACVGSPSATQVQIQTGQVTALTATSTVETSGTIEPLQMASLTWKTTGRVAEVRVRPGDKVKPGDILMALDPTSTSQAVIQAQTELVNAQIALDELLNPTALVVANAQKGVADARDNLEAKQKTFRSLTTPDVAYYTDQLRRAQESLTAAQQNAEVTSFATNLRNAEDALTNVTERLNALKELERQYPGYGQQHGDILTRTQQEYDRVLQDYQSAKYNFEQAQNNSNNTVLDAQGKVTDAKANLAAVQSNPDTIALAQAEADVAVAQATLTDKEKALADLQNGGDPEDVAAARARVLAAQANVDMLYLTAPFEGEVMSVSAQVGDLASQTNAAMVLANRAVLHVDVSVDESDVARIAVGDGVNVSFNSIGDLELTGTVSEVNPVGQTVQGLVRYTVTIDLPTADPRVLLGMTADVAIVTDVEKDALAVPIDAVQSDEQGEYVLRVKSASGEVERVAVQSGVIQDDFVVVKGSLAVGDTVQIPAREPQNIGPFGGG